MVDGYGNIYAPMLPLLIPRLGLSLAAAGTLTMLFQLAASVAQVGFGHLADRWRPRLLDHDRPGRGGRLLSLVGLATTAWRWRRFWWSAALAPRHSIRLPQRSRIVSAASAGGSRCRSTLPAARWALPWDRCCFAPFAQRFGIEWTPVLALPGLAVVAFFLRRVPPIPAAPIGARRSFGAASLREAAVAAVYDCRAADAGSLTSRRSFR